MGAPALHPTGSRSYGLSQTEPARRSQPTGASQDGQPHLLLSEFAPADGWADLAGVSSCPWPYR